jgi:hypothetical protein
MAAWVDAHVVLAVGLAGLGCAVAGPGCVAIVEGALGIGVSNYGTLSQAGNYLIRSYNELKNLVYNPNLQIHHILERRFFEIGSLQNSMNEDLSIVVTKAEHIVFTNAWRTAIGYSNSNNPITTLNASPEQIFNSAKSIYADYPAIMRVVENYIFR